MPLHETVTEGYVAELCENYLIQSAWANAADSSEKELRRVAAARPYAVAVERAESEWTKPEVETELNIRLMMGHLMRISPGSVQFAQGY